MFLVGLTGGIATGKSTVSQIFKDLGCPIVDADLIAREVVEPGTQGLRKIQEIFGTEVILPDGQLDREALGKIIFSDKTKRQALNSITHPQIYKAMLWKLAILLIKGHPFAILDLPLLFESKKMVPYMSFTVVVSCSEEQQLSRLQTRNKYTQEEAQQRINAQIPLAEKCQQATYVIDNSGDLENTKRQVEDIYKKIISCKLQWKFRIVVLSMLTLVTSVAGYFLFR